MSKAEMKRAMQGIAAQLAEKPDRNGEQELNRLALQYAETFLGWTGSMKELVKFEARYFQNGSRKTYPIAVTYIRGSKAVEKIRLIK